MIVGIDEDEASRERLAEAGVVADVLFLVDEDVVAGRCADAVAADVERAMVGVDADVEQRAAVARPLDLAARVGDLVGEVLAGLHVADADGEQLRALVVDGVGEQLVVGAVGAGAEVPVGLALGLGVAVEEQGLGPAAAAADARGRGADTGRQRRRSNSTRRRRRASGRCCRPA